VSRWYFLPDGLLCDVTCIHRVVRKSYWSLRVKLEVNFALRAQRRNHGGRDDRNVKRYHDVSITNAVGKPCAWTGKTKKTVLYAYKDTFLFFRSQNTLSTAVLLCKGRTKAVWRPIKKGERGGGNRRIRPVRDGENAKPCLDERKSGRVVLSSRLVNRQNKRARARARETFTSPRSIDTSGAAATIRCFIPWRTLVSRKRTYNTIFFCRNLLLREEEEEKKYHAGR
jgi:hypothetical protein